MKKMKKLLITCSLTFVLFASSSIPVFADPTSGTVEPNSFKANPSTEKASSHLSSNVIIL